MISKNFELRSGAAIVEVALTLPLLILISLATLDTCKVMFVRQSAKIAAYECARVAIIPGATTQLLESQCRAFLTPRGVSQYAITISEPGLANLRKGQLLTVSISVPAKENSLGASWFYRDRNFVESVTILVEQ
jgi:Flp pilus assembly protein TadG